MNLIFTKSLHSAEGKKVNQLFMQRGFFPKEKHKNRFYDILDPSEARSIEKEMELDRIGTRVGIVSGDTVRSIE